MWKCLAVLIIVAGCGSGLNLSSGELGPFPICPKGTMWTSTRGGDGSETLTCLKKCWMDSQCEGSDGRCQDSVCVNLQCLRTLDQSTCLSNTNCYWHKSTSMQDLSRCSSGYDAS